MPSLAHLAIFTLAALAMNAAPGPSNLYVLSRSLAQGAAGGTRLGLGPGAGEPLSCGARRGRARRFAELRAHPL